MKCRGKREGDSSTNALLSCKMLKAFLALIVLSSIHIIFTFAVDCGDWSYRPPAPVDFKGSRV